jgi:hypothetical protein
VIRSEQLRTPIRSVIKQGYLSYLSLILCDFPSGAYVKISGKVSFVIWRGALVWWSGSEVGAEIKCRRYDFAQEQAAFPWATWGTGSERCCGRVAWLFAWAGLFCGRARDPSTSLRMIPW